MDWFQGWMGANRNDEIYESVRRSRWSERQGPRGGRGVQEIFRGGRMGNSWEDMDMRRGLS